MKFLESVFIVLICTLCFLFAILVIAMIVDEFTSERTAIIERSCIDKNGGVFNDELCQEEIMCGIIAKSLNKDRCYPEGNLLSDFSEETKQ